MSLAVTATKAITSDRFQRWIERRRHLMYGCVHEREATRWLLRECGAASIEELDTNKAAGARFRELCEEFKAAVAETA